MMENIDVNAVFLAVATAMAGFSVLLVWIYLFEVARGIDSLSFIVCKNYVKVTFWISCISMLFLWMSVTGVNEKLFKMLVLYMAVWFATAVVALLASLPSAIHTDNKKKMRQFIIPCIGKVFLLMIIMWLLY